MHSRIEELLSAQAGEPLAHVHRHLQGCLICQAEMQRLRTVSARLQALAQLDAPDAAWLNIRNRLQQRSRGTSKAVTAIAAAIAAAVMLGALVRDDTPSPQLAFDSSARMVPINDTESTQISSLVARSRELDAALTELPQRPQVERASTSATIDTLEHRIQWLDFNISYAATDALNDEQSARLWSERVTLMDSLLKVRYAQAREVFF
jgi:hypothetical protein